MSKPEYSWKQEDGLWWLSAPEGYDVCIDHQTWRHCQQYEVTLWERRDYTGDEIELECGYVWDLEAAFQYGEELLREQVNKVTNYEPEL